MNTIAATSSALDNIKVAFQGNIANDEHGIPKRCVMSIINLTVMQSMKITRKLRFVSLLTRLVQ
jgi:hypothetical protein